MSIAQETDLEVFHLLEPGLATEGRRRCHPDGVLPCRRAEVALVGTAPGRA